MAKLLAFPGAQSTSDEVDESQGVVRDILGAFTEHADEMSFALVIGIKENGQLSWSCSTSNLLEILWATQAMQRVVMDYSLGVHDEGDYDA